MFLEIFILLLTWISACSWTFSFLLQGSESPEKHFVYVWDNFISKAAAQSIVVVAHSYGGIVIVEGVNWIFNGIIWW